MCFHIHSLKARFLLNYQSLLQDVTSSFSSGLPFSISFLYAFSKTDRSLHKAIYHNCCMARQQFWVHTQTHTPSWWCSCSADSTNICSSILFVHAPLQAVTLDLHSHVCNPHLFVTSCWFCKHVVTNIHWNLLGNIWLLRHTDSSKMQESSHPINSHLFMNGDVVILKNLCILWNTSLTFKME